MSTNPALVFIYIWLGIFIAYIAWLFWTANRRGGPRW